MLQMFSIFFWKTSSFIPFASLLTTEGSLDKLSYNYVWKILSLSFFFLNHGKQMQQELLKTVLRF